MARSRLISWPGTALIAVLFLAPVHAGAETTKSFQVSADIVKGCIVATNGTGQWGQIDFGTVSGVASGTVVADLVASAVAGIQIDCTPNVTASLTADSGNNAVGGVRQLGLNGGASALVPYRLYADGASTPWTTQSLPLSFSLGTTRRVLPIQGRATLTRPTAAGSYSDTVRVTLTW